jgi:hypothetical protein
MKLRVPKSLEEWKLIDPVGYRLAQQRKIVEIVCTREGWELPVVHIKWTLDKCKESAKRFKTRKEWQDGDKNAYQNASKKGWREECCAHMEVRRVEWTKEMCMESALPFKTKKEWENNDTNAYATAQRKGWINDCCAHMEILLLNWTKEICIESARQFKTKAEWRREDNKAFQAAKRNKWMADCCSHMISPQVTKGYWTKEKCIESAKKFKTRGEWHKGDPKAYQAAIRIGYF